MDWDKLRVFLAVADAGSFTRGGEMLGTSQSALSRKIGSLEKDLNTTLFHRHARGLVLTEQGNQLVNLAREMNEKLVTTSRALSETRETPKGLLRVTAPPGIGSVWLTSILKEFFDLHPNVSVEFVLTDEEIDLSMGEADVAIRMRQPQQPSIIQRKLFTVHFHLYAAPSYISSHGIPYQTNQLNGHRVLLFGGQLPQHLAAFSIPHSWLNKEENQGLQRLTVNNIIALKVAIEEGIGIGALPDYLIGNHSKLVRLFENVEIPALDAYLAYPETLRHAAKVRVFCDFLISKSKRWYF